jgi:hypothetical protein
MLSRSGKDAALIGMMQKNHVGQYITGSKARLTNLQKQIVKEDRNITTGLQQSHESELAEKVRLTKCKFRK